jgi:hypothetical protein
MRWEYEIAWIRFEPGQEWLVRHEGKDWPVHDYLRVKGEDGWELVAAVITWAMHGGGTIPGSYRPGHWLYFKRPKP